MNAVGIDVSNGKSTVAVLRPLGITVFTPFEVRHTPEGIGQLIQQIKSLEGETRIVMEHTGRYYESIANTLHEAGCFVCAVNPLLIKEYGGNSIRKVKTDKADARKIAKYALDNWAELRHYTPMDTKRYELKTLNRQFQLASKNRTACSNNLIALLEQSYPGIRSQFSSPARTDGSQKWVDFVYTFWHVDCVRAASLKAFTARYSAWCKRHGYNFSEEKAVELHAHARQRIALVGKSDITKLMIREAVKQLNVISHTVEALRTEMDKLASELPEYPVVMGMYGVGKSLGPQLMAEIGDIRRFAGRQSLIAFAGVDPSPNESGSRASRSNKTTKRGSPYLRKTLFNVMDSLLKLSPEGQPVYEFLDKKRSEGKPYYVYMTAGANKFLRIYYAKIRDYFATLDDLPDVSETSFSFRSSEPEPRLPVDPDTL